MHGRPPSLRGKEPRAGAPSGSRRIVRSRRSRKAGHWRPMGEDSGGRPRASAEVPVPLGVASNPVPDSSAASRRAVVAPLPQKAPVERPSKHAEPVGPAPQRDVTFLVLPAGALVSIDSGPAEGLFQKT